MNGVADLASGKGPTITQAADGTLQVLTNNNSGDEVQFQKDGTLTWVNGGNAPGIFSVSPFNLACEQGTRVILLHACSCMLPIRIRQTCPCRQSSCTETEASDNYLFFLAGGNVAHSPDHRKLALALHNHIAPAITGIRDVWLYMLSADVQVGPKGVHMEKDNVFNSQAYAAGAPSVTISNDPSTASSSGSQTAYSGTAAAQAPTTSTYQNSQNTQSTQSTNSRTNQAATSSSYSAGVHCLLLAPVSSQFIMTLPYRVA